ncbi:L-aspartate oxidase [Alicyclobacillus cellulosilyticus]|uniref:L-aspartate oxidase n=1 Tax=Alicyclobacillus cellulosilyticus TaxID=1003997 RepID=A0A917NML8_9BACL|nr:FAD-binding protein [Alicyclobacillus cellulosilyticus]GGJ11945.1 L-aspartate oxidase [Alicyclobacillus cellulosilyticus]
MTMRRMDADFVILGGGLAGHAAAYWLSEIGDVALVQKTPPAGSNSAHAQGGIAAAVGDGDSPALHAADTIAAGDGLCRAEAVERLTARAPEVVRWLMELGVPFDRDAAGRLRLGLEGAHSRPRILHAGGDATGRHVMAVLAPIVAARANVVCVKGTATRLWLAAGRVQGAMVRTEDGLSAAGNSAGMADAARDGAGAAAVSETMLVTARRAVVIATGGAGQLFACTTNPQGALGEGLALAFAAGATLRNMEFVQFHPTALDAGDNPRFLLTEALRGAGARLIDSEERPILARHPLGDLAPRDVVARAVFACKLEGRPVYLDCRHIPDLAERFPTVYAGCLAHGLDPARHPLPVTPAAHFLMGGITAAMDGRTDVPGLFAIGEAANTGCHGANRLASNSLLECLVMAYELYQSLRGDAIEAAGTASATRAGSVDAELDAELDTGFTTDPPAFLAELQQWMWRYAGVIRDEAGLRMLLRQLAAWAEERPHSAAVCVAQRIAEAALARRESRGAHYRRDYPEADPRLAGVDTVLAGRRTEDCRAAASVPAGVRKR